MKGIYDSWGTTDNLEVDLEEENYRLKSRPNMLQVLLAKRAFQSIIISGGLFLIFWLLATLINLSSRDALVTPQLEIESKKEETQEPISPISELSGRRNQAWQEVQLSCGGKFFQVLASTNEQVRIARGDAWLLFAKRQCDADKNCQSPYDWLRKQFDVIGAELQETTLGDRLPIKASEVAKYRQKQSDLQDIATALSIGVSGQRAVSWIPTDALSRAIDDCSTAAKRFETMTEAVKQEVESFPGVESNETF
jgi:hypothetical protein